MNLPDKDIKHFLDEALARKMVAFYVSRVCGYGNYMPYQCAFHKVAYDAPKKYQEDMLLFLVLANKKKEGVTGAWRTLMAHGRSVKYIEKLLRRFDTLGINPVTISVKWVLDSLPNPLPLLFTQEA